MGSILISDFTNAKEAFKTFMGKDYDCLSEQASEHAIYQIFKSAKKERQISPEVMRNIKKLHPYNQQAILFAAHRISQKNEKISQYFAQLLLRHDFEHPIEQPRFNFEPALEETSKSTSRTFFTAAAILAIAIPFLLLCSRLNRQENQLKQFQNDLNTCKAHQENQPPLAAKWQMLFNQCLEKSELQNQQLLQCAHNMTALTANHDAICKIKNDACLMTNRDWLQHSDAIKEIFGKAIDRCDQSLLSIQREKAEFNSALNLCKMNLESEINHTQNLESIISIQKNIIAEK